MKISTFDHWVNMQVDLLYLNQSSNASYLITCNQGLPVNDEVERYIDVKSTVGINAACV